MNEEEISSVLINSKEFKEIKEFGGKINKILPNTRVFLRNASNIFMELNGNDLYPVESKNLQNKIDIIFIGHAIIELNQHKALKELFAHKTSKIIQLQVAGEKNFVASQFSLEFYDRMNLAYLEQEGEIRQYFSNTLNVQIPEET